MTLRFLAVFVALGCAWAQDLAVQREAMRKLAFLEGSWSGEAAVGPQRMRIADVMTSKLDGLVMQMERTGRDAQGAILFEALATISFDDSKRQYRFRAHVQGKFIDAEFKAGEKSYEWTYREGPALVRHAMRLTSGEWTEFAELANGVAAPQKMMEMRTRRIR